MKKFSVQEDSKAKIERIKAFVTFRQYLINELKDIDTYQKKVEKVRKYYVD